MFFIAPRLQFLLSHSPTTKTVPMSPQSKEFSERALPVFTNSLRDKSPDVVARACDTIGEIAQILGPVAVNQCTYHTS